MRYIYILNSFGLKSKLNSVKEKIEAYSKNNKLDYLIEINGINNTTEDILKKYKKSRNVIIAVGGDGTLNRVLNSIVGTKNILGLIPYGTGNDFYKTCKETLKDGIQKIDLIKINDKHFINVACFGLDADIGNNDNVIHSKLIPEKQRYNMGILCHFLKYKPRSIKVKVGKEIIDSKATTVAVCNGRYYGGGYKIGYQSLVNDHLMEVYYINKMSKLNMALLMKGMNKGKHEFSKHTKKWLTTKVEIISPIEIESNIDGEKLKSKEFTIELIPDGIEFYYNEELIEKVYSN